MNALRYRTVAECCDCNRETSGVTTVHSRDRRIHRCDECRSKLTERPLVTVLRDYLSDD